MAVVSAQMAIDQRLIDVAQAEIDLHARCQHLPCVIKASVPILFFGDSARYAQSPMGIVTVGPNPSCHEFPAHDPRGWRGDCEDHAA